MMKKLFTLLLTLFMVLCAFTVKVNAGTTKSSKTINDLLEGIVGGFPTSEADAWVGPNSGKIYLSNGYLVTPACNINANEKNALDIDSDTGIFSYNTDCYTLVFIKNLDFKVEYIDIVNARDIYKSYEGRYKSPLPTIGDFLASYNFPVSTDGSVPSNAWTKDPEDNVSCYIDTTMESLIIRQMYGDHLYSMTYLTTKLYKVNDNQYRNYYSTMFFNLESGVLKNITTTGFVTEIDWINGIYTYPKTVKDIISTTPNTPYDYNYGWVNENGQRAYLNGETLSVGVSSIGLVNPLLKDGDNYTYTDFYGTVYTFTMVNNELKSIVVTNNTSNPDDNGTYLPPLSISDVLPEDFPTTYETAWVSEQGNRVYIEGGMLYFQFEFGASGYSLFNPIYKNDDGNYTYENDQIIFVMKNNVLENVSIKSNDELEVFATYASVDNIEYKKEGDILVTVNIQYGTPSKSTVKIDGNTTLTQDNEYTINYNKPVTITLLKSYIKTLSEGKHTLSIIIDGYTVKDIEFTVSNSKPTPGGGSSHYVIPKTGIK